MSMFLAWVDFLEDYVDSSDPHVNLLREGRSGLYTENKSECFGRMDEGEEMQGPETLVRSSGVGEGQQMWHEESLDLREKLRKYCQGVGRKSE